jgi:hypothetical protein
MAAALKTTNTNKMRRNMTFSLGHLGPTRPMGGILWAGVPMPAPHTVEVNRTCHADDLATCRKCIPENKLRRIREISAINLP